MGQRTRRARRHKDMVGGVVHAEPAVQAFGHGPAGGRQRQRRRITVQPDGVGVGQQVLASRGELRRAGDRRVAQRVIEHVLVADLRAAGGAPFRNLTDNRLGAQHIFIVLCNHNNSSFLKCLSKAGRVTAALPLVRNPFTAVRRGRACPARSLAVVSPLTVCIVGRGLDPSAGRRGRRPLQRSARLLLIANGHGGLWAGRPTYGP